MKQVDYMLIVISRKTEPDGEPSIATTLIKKVKDGQAFVTKLCHYVGFFPGTSFCFHKTRHYLRVSGIRGYIRTIRKNPYDRTNALLLF